MPGASYRPRENFSTYQQCCQISLATRNGHKPANKLMFIINFGWYMVREAIFMERCRAWTFNCDAVQGSL